MVDARAQSVWAVRLPRSTGKGIVAEVVGNAQFPARLVTVVAPTFTAPTSRRAVPLQAARRKPNGGSAVALPRRCHTGGTGVIAWDRGWQCRAFRVDRRCVVVSSCPDGGDGTTGRAVRHDAASHSFIDGPSGNAAAGIPRSAAGEVPAGRSGPKRAEGTGCTGRGSLQRGQAKMGASCGRRPAPQGARERQNGTVAVLMEDT